MTIRVIKGSKKKMLRFYMRFLTPIGTFRSEDREVEDDVELAEFKEYIDRICKDGGHISFNNAFPETGATERVYLPKELVAKSVIMVVTREL